MRFVIVGLTVKACVGADTITEVVVTVQYGDCVSTTLITYVPADKPAITSLLSVAAFACTVPVIPVGAKVVALST